MGPIKVMRGDITRVEADAIVNAANSALAGGGGVDGAIHEAAGPELDEACRRWIAEHVAVPPGSAAITPGFRLHARWIVHAVGPVWQGGGAHEADTLESAYRASVELADENGCRTIALPSISTGAFGYPTDLAAPVALTTVREALDSAQNVREATFVLRDERTYQTYMAYERTWERVAIAAR